MWVNSYTLIKIFQCQLIISTAVIYRTAIEPGGQQIRIHNNNFVEISQGFPFLKRMVGATLAQDTALGLR